MGDKIYYLLPFQPHFKWPQFWGTFPSSHSTLFTKLWVYEKSKMIYRLGSSWLIFDILCFYQVILAFEWFPYHFGSILRYILWLQFLSWSLILLLTIHLTSILQKFFMAGFLSALVSGGSSGQPQISIATSKNGPADLIGFAHPHYKIALNIYFNKRCS